MPLISSVLLVDDDSTANFLHKLLLTKMEVARSILVAEHGQQALDLLATAAEPPALILLDLNMPVLNGPGFLARYAELPPATPRPVIAVLSSSDHALDVARAQPWPVDSFLTKPLTREKVALLLEQHFAG